MKDWSSHWQQWLHDTQGLPTVQWALLLAVAAVAGHVLQRASGLPKVVGYTLVGTLAGLVGFGDVAWPLSGQALYLVELGVALVLFECGGRIPLAWFRHNPMLLVQSVAESLLTFVCVWLTLAWLGMDAALARALALVAVAASPTVLTRVMADTHAAGPVSERALALSTLSSLYALAFAGAQAGLGQDAGASWLGAAGAVLRVLGVSVALGALLALLLRLALRVMSPIAENTALLLLLLLAAACALTPALGGSAPLAALLAGVLLKQIHPRPLAWPRQTGTAASLLTLLMFVLVSNVAAHAPWSTLALGAVLALVLVRLLAKAAGVALGNAGSAASWRQALWTASAMAPLSAVALLVAAQLAGVSAEAPLLSAVALPAILLMEILGAVVCAYAIYRAGESAKPWRTPGAARARADKEQP